jgi:hypothetical protein
MLPVPTDEASVGSNSAHESGGANAASHACNRAIRKRLDKLRQPTLLRFAIVVKESHYVPFYPGEPARNRRNVSRFINL